MINMTNSANVAMWLCTFKLLFRRDPSSYLSVVVRSALSICRSEPWFQRPGPIPSKEGPPINGAGEGNRTPVVSLEGFCSTIELHPPENQLPIAVPLNTYDGGGSWIRTNVGVRQRVYSPSPLATRASLLYHVHLRLIGRKEPEI